MAEVSAEMLVPAASDDVDFSLDIPGAEVVVEDLDFELGEGNEGASLEQDDGDGPTSTLETIEIAADVDEIGYEDDEGHADPVPESTVEADYHIEESDTSVHEKAGDELDYEGVEIVETTITTHDDIYNLGKTEHQDNVEEETKMDFGFDEGGDSRLEEGDYDEPDEIDHGDFDQDDDSLANNVKDDGSEIADDREEDDENSEDGEGGKNEDGDEEDDDVFGHDVDGEDNIDENTPSETGFDELRNMYPASTFHVVVTWGRQMCPLFKMPGEENPDSFYLDDYEAMNYPLSKFLQTIRTSISSWVDASDEIYIRVEELGLEFGETTTEALLSQVTFHNLLALHSTLAKNDDTDAAKGVHITLSTRSNCLLRLKELVGGAGSGKGLSWFQSGSPQKEELSDESLEAEAESDDSSRDDELEDAFEEALDEDVEEEEDDGDDGDEDHDEDVGIDVDVTGSPGEQSVASQSFAEAAAKESGGTTLETPIAEDQDSANTGAIDEADYVDYTNDDDDDPFNSVLQDPERLSEMATPHADFEDDPSFAADEDDHLSGLDGGLADNEQQNYPELSEDINEGLAEHHEEGAIAHTLDDLESVKQNSAYHGENGDDFLDLHGDTHDSEARAETQQANAKADTEESVGSSATATMDHDEIDYEEHHTAGTKENAPPSSTVDEIDWDDELKKAASTSPSVSGKRTREIDETGDALLDEIPDFKRQRNNQTPP
ncbi:hypothetical protein SEPCBS57363_006159 [Sporothrix epigloea]|uniref:Uncharacterized protein n=1 Tax=Sporothrix epigloea TaxID=1892477 RepID=A0ABP0E1J4_9PEZI